MLAGGKDLALVTNAGTPGISDPGSYLIQLVSQRLPDVKIIPIPGPSALAAALSVSGLRGDQFLFLGFPPHKKGRKTFFERLKGLDMPAVFYESPHRILKTLEGLEQSLGPKKEIIVMRELTKLHEEIFRGIVSEAQAHFKGEHKKGEFSIILPV
jgi:16S rRNA (cytidine1402-2'-O)-methyltransferase